MKYYKLIAATGLIASLALPAFAENYGSVKLDSDIRLENKMDRRDGGGIQGNVNGDIDIRRDGKGVFSDKINTKFDAKADAKLNVRRQSFENSVGVRIRSIFDRLANIQSRIETRLNAAKARGVNTASAEASLKASRNHSGEAERIAVSIQAKLDASTDQTNKEQLRADIKKDFDTMKTHLKEAYEDLRDAWKFTVQSEASVNASANQQ